MAHRFVYMHGHHHQAFRLPALTALRAFAALWVVVFHYGNTIAPFRYAKAVFGVGHLAVSFFFVLSGFILAWNYLEKPLRLKSFLARRAARIVPATLVAMILCYWLYYGGHALARITAERGEALGFVRGVFFVQSLWPEHAIHLNVPAWSVSVEMIFYLLFPLLIFICRKSRRLMMVLTMLIIIATVCAMAYYLPFITRRGDFYVKDFFNFHPLPHLYKFCLGMAAAVWLLRDAAAGSKVAHPFIPVIALIILLCFIRPIQQPLWVPLITLLFTYGICCFAMGNVPRWLCSRPLILLGEVSFGIYIYQTPVHDALATANARWLHLSEGIFFYGFVVALTSVAVASYYLLELPIIRLVHRYTARA